MNAQDFIRIGNNIINVAHVVSVEFDPAVKPIYNSDDSRVVSGDFHRDDRGRFVDEYGEQVSSHIACATVITTAIRAEKIYTNYDPGETWIATNLHFKAYGVEAEAVMRWFASFAASPVIDEDREA